MRIKPNRRASASVLALAALLAVTGGAAVALAANQIKGATYKGKISLSHASNITLTIRFRVSANGKRVSSFTLTNGYPIYCQGGGFGTAQSASGTITKDGTFTVKLPLYFAPAHQHQGFVVITGKFAKHGKESGKVKTDFTHSSRCNGTATYSTKA
jgi:hypothetical protein